VGVSIDVTRQAHHRVEFERRLRAIVDNAYQFIGLLEVDGTLIEVNQTALAFAGVTRDEVVGKKFWDTPWWRGSEAAREKLRASFACAVAGEFVRYDTEVRGKGRSSPSTSP
jgi:PAS domain S-box-containing protein